MELPNVPLVTEDGKTIMLGDYEKEVAARGYFKLPPVLLFERLPSSKLLHYLPTTLHSLTPLPSLIFLLL